MTRNFNYIDVRQEDMLSKILIEITTVLIAGGVGIAAYKSMNRFFRLLFLQLLSWLVIYCLSRFVTFYQKQHNLPLNNIWVFNLQILIETTLLSLAVYYSGFIGKAKLLIFAYLVFICIYVVGISQNSVFSFNEGAYMYECFLMCALSGVLLFLNFRLSENSYKHALSWALTGTLVYFACNMPYFGLFNYLNAFNLELSERLHYFIIDVVSNIRYVCLAVAFLILIMNGKRNRIVNLQ